MKERLHNIHMEVCGLIWQLNLQLVTDSALKNSVCLVIFSQMSYAKGKQVLLKGNSTLKIWPKSAPVSVKSFRIFVGSNKK